MKSTSLLDQNIKSLLQLADEYAQARHTKGSSLYCIETNEVRKRLEKSLREILSKELTQLSNKGIAK
jgi:muramidase (phage lysozyme)